MSPFNLVYLRKTHSNLRVVDPSRSGIQPEKQHSKSRFVTNSIQLISILVEFFTKRAPLSEIRVSHFLVSFFLRVTFSDHPYFFDLKPPSFDPPDIIFSQTLNSNVVCCITMLGKLVFVLASVALLSCAIAQPSDDSGAASAQPFAPSDNLRNQTQQILSGAVQNISAALANNSIESAAFWYAADVLTLVQNSTLNADQVVSFWRCTFKSQISRFS